MTNTFAVNPIIERFTLRGVHGYKDININFNQDATIIVAENGTGKTTVLSALNAFLTKRFHRLAALSFTSLECKFSGIPQPIILRRESLGSNENDTLELLRSVSTRASISEDELLDFIQNEYNPTRYDALKHYPIISQIYINTPGTHQDAKKSLDDLHALHNSSLSKDAKSTADTLRGLLKDIDIVYLPTFRRIERPLLRTSKRRENHPAYRLPGTSNEKNDYTYEGIAFGLGDIEARLGELSEEIERASNFGYRSLSARILNDMLKGQSFHSPETPTDLPDIKALSLFLSRVGRAEGNLGHIFANIENLYDSGGILSSEFEFLRYFLTRLSAVINQTKSMEQKIEQFVNVCNSYLTMSTDEKQLAFDPQTLKVVVQNSWANCTVPLDALSSGEKQIVSLMAKLYLYERRKLVLIDEPELSLSIDWQRRVLPDILSSGSVVQLLAITHSPFVFENDLDGCAIGMQITRSREQAN